MTHKLLQDVGVNMKKNATFTKCTPTGKREGDGGEKTWLHGLDFQSWEGGAEFLQEQVAAKFSEGD